MTATENPLLIYYDWFSNLPQTWVEPIASFTFDTVRHYQPLQHYCPSGAGKKPYDSKAEQVGHFQWLIWVIKDHICNQDPYLVQELAVLLHVSTHMVIDSRRQLKNKRTKGRKRAYLRSLLIGDLSAAAYCESEMNGSADQQVYYSWHKISSTGFSFDAIHHYLIEHARD